MRIAGVIAAVLLLGSTGCGGGGTKTTVVTQTVVPAPATAPTTTPAAATTTAAAPVSSGADTRPGTTLALGKSATVHYVPPGNTKQNATGNKLVLTVLSIEKGAIDPDFNNIQLPASEKHKTPYYVRLREQNVGPGDIKSADMPTFAFDAIDDRGEQQGDLTILGTFTKCDDKLAPKPSFKAGATFETCRIYLVGGGGSIKSVQWSSTSGAGYSDKPITWTAG
jgi:hypothetical protein